ncbi:MAG: CmpA/NrtA family ABC transporter substrate-binding protein [Parvibaculum sp.]|uniref:CmpA/NrtA family ABC transporter substrate-binding protein n=1 Tax=Parvibaculum sp. TaxID=2024848 RepID=UPI0032ECDAF1
MKDKDMKTIDRRGVLKTGGKLIGAAALLKAAGAVVPGGAWAAGSEGIEKTDLTLGIIPLTDCAPLVIAHEKGYFSKYGINSQISKEASWANIRDKVSIGALDAAHMLAGMPIASSLGVGAIKKPTITSYSMDLNGNGITVSNELYDRMVEADPEAMVERPVSARALKKVIEADKAAGADPMTFAMVFPVSTHNYELRYWMADAGIDPDKDVRLIVIPPPQMVANLRAQNIVGYCVGEPWNERAVIAGMGKTLVTNHEIWNNNPEKVVGVNLDWAEKNPNTHMAMIRALVEAAQWMDKPENRLEVVEIISRKSYVNAPVDVVKMSMTGTFRYAMDEEPRPLPDFNVFYRYAATFPWKSHAMWFISQMIRWGQIEKPLDIAKTAGEIYRPDIYREAVKSLGIPAPTIDVKTEGTHAEPWTLEEATKPIVMGSDLFFNGDVFDPSNILSYIEGFEVKNLAFAMDELSKLNS